jgi:hypothetical protein
LIWTTPVVGVVVAVVMVMEVVAVRLSRLEAALG